MSDRWRTFLSFAFLLLALLLAIGISVYEHTREKPARLEGR